MTTLLNRQRRELAAFVFGAMFVIGLLWVGWASVDSNRMIRERAVWMRKVDKDLDRIGREHAAMMEQMRQEMRVGR